VVILSVCLSRVCFACVLCPFSPSLSCFLCLSLSLETDWIVSGTYLKGLVLVLSCLPHPRGERIASASFLS